MADSIVIVSYARTPIGAFQGMFSNLKATDLGAAAVKAVVERSGIAPERVERIYMGCVLPACLGQAPARQAALGAGLPQSVEATTINKMCGSAMQAAIMAYDTIAAGSADIVIAGGMESMTNAPYAMPKHRSGARIGHDRIIDTMMMDGLEDAYTPGKPMGAFAEDVARNYQFSREAQDTYALRSLSRANTAIAQGYFTKEIVPVGVPAVQAATVVSTDEQPGKAKPEKIPTLRPVFAKDGTITAANASSISDGAAALLMARRSVAEKLGLPVAAEIVAHSSYAHEPALFATAPAPSIEKVLSNCGWSAGEVDLFEVNEAFAVVAMVAARELDIPIEKLNVNGGATALGHPIGASGARIIATLLAALEHRHLKRGVASICIGGGEATSMAVRLI